MQLLHRSGIDDEENSIRVLATFSDLFPGAKTPVNRERAVRGRVAIWTSKWADDKIRECYVSSIGGRDDRS